MNEWGSLEVDEERKSCIRSGDSINTMDTECTTPEQEALVTKWSK